MKFNMNDSKELMRNALTEHRNKVIAELDEIVAEVDNSNSIPEMIGELVKVCGNNNQQKGVMISIMRTIPSNYFQFATVKREMNAISFEFNGITFSMSISRVKTIKISLSKIEKPIEPSQETYRTYSSYEADFLEQWSGKLSELDRTTDKKLIESYFNVRNRRSVPFLYTRKLRKENYEKIKMYLEDIRKRMDTHEEEKQNIKEIYNEYEAEVKKYNELLAETKSNFKVFIEENNYIVKDFKGESWRVKFIDVPDEWMQDINV